MTLNPAPISMGICQTNSMLMRMAGKPLPVDEYVQGMRLVGNTFFHFDQSDQVTSGQPSQTQMGTGSSGTATSLWQNNASANDYRYCRRLTPAALGQRVAIMGSFHRFYAIRHLRFQWVPLVATSTPGQIAVSVLRDVSPLQSSNYTTGADSLTTMEGVMSCVPAMSFPTWEPCSMLYSYRGKRVWRITQPSSFENEAGDHIQAVVAAFLTGGSVSTIYGRLALEYIIDLYEPGPQLGGGSITTVNPTLPRAIPAPPIPEEKSYVSVQEREPDSSNATPRRSISVPARTNRS